MGGGIAVSKKEHSCTMSSSFDLHVSQAHIHQTKYDCQSRFRVIQYFTH